MLNKLTGERCVLSLALLLVLAFSSVYWITQLIYNWGEPGDLIAFYHYLDFNNFPKIVRLLRSPFHEYTVLDSTGGGIVPVQVATFWPYSIAHILFGGFGFWLGDIIANGFRFFSMIYLVSIFSESRRNVILMAIALFFLSSEFIFGDTGPFHGIWAVHIPRGIMAGTYLILGIAVLAKLPELLTKPGLKPLKLCAAALPMVLCLNADLYSMPSLGLTYFLFIVYWFQAGKISLKKICYFIGTGALLGVPVLLYMRSSNPSYTERFGLYNISTYLFTMEIPYRAHLALAFVSVVLLAFLKRSRPNDLGLRVLAINTALFIFSFFAAPLNAAILQFGVEDYHYALVRDHLAGFLICLWALYLINLAARAFPVGKKAQPVFLIMITAVAASVSFIKYSAHVLNMARARTEPELGFAQQFHNGWRSSARELYDLLRERAKDSKIVIATFDTEMRTLSGMIPNVYQFLPQIFHTTATTTELEERFAIFCNLLDIDVETYTQLVSIQDIQISFLTGALYQFNRINIRAKLSDYPPQSLDQLAFNLDNWGVLPPVSEIRRMRTNYETVRALPPGHPLFSKYWLPDLIIMPRAWQSTNSPRGYSLIKENQTFRVYERRG